VNKISADIEKRKIGIEQFLKISNDTLNLTDIMVNDHMFDQMDVLFLQTLLDSIIKCRKNYPLEKHEYHVCVPKSYSELNRNEKMKNGRFNPALRSLGLNCNSSKCRIPVSLSGIWNYGCWCNFGNNILQGQGPPQNKHDSACQKMQLCLRCAKLDAKNEGAECDPKTSSFNTYLSFGTNSLDAECASKNKDDKCATNLCMCEMQFIADLVDLIWEDYTYDPTVKHLTSGGPFDYVSNCELKQGSNPTNFECCGFYPDRAPYSEDGNRSCCNIDQNIFNNLSHKCCENSGVVEIGGIC